MPRDSSGNFTLVAGNPVITGTTITSSWGNTTMNDIANVLTASLDRSGNGSMLAALKILDGTQGAPGLAFGAEPSTGLYRAAANTIGISIGGTLRLGLSTTTMNLSGHVVTLNAPATPTTLIVQSQGAVAGSGTPAVLISANAAQPGCEVEVALQSVDSVRIGVELAGHCYIGAGGVLSFRSGGYATANEAGTLGPNRNWVLNSPVSGSTLTLNGGIAFSPTLSVGIGGSSSVSVAIANSSAVYAIETLAATAQSPIMLMITSGKVYQFWIGNTIANAFSLTDNGVDRLQVTSAGNIILPGPTSGVGIIVNGFNGVHSAQIADSATALFNAGFLEVPVIAKGGSFAPVLSDSGKAYSMAAGITATIPSNATVAYPVGTTLTFINVSGGAACSIAITTDSLIWLGTGAVGTRTLANAGRATAHKITATSWIISGVNLS